MGKGIRKANESVRERNANEEETRRAECFDAETPTGKRRSGEEYDVEKG